MTTCRAPDDRACCFAIQPPRPAVADPQPIARGHPIACGAHERRGGARAALRHDFTGRTAVVTGAASGIGQAVAELLRDGGARVVGVDLDPSGVPPGCIALRPDVADPEAASAAARQVLDEVGPVELLMNNAGIGSTTDVVACTSQEWDRVFAVNVRSVFLWTRALVPSMLVRSYGSIVNTASVLALVAAPDRAA